MSIEDRLRKSLAQLEHLQPLDLDFVSRVASALPEHDRTQSGHWSPVLLAALTAAAATVLVVGAVQLFRPGGGLFGSMPTNSPSPSAESSPPASEAPAPSITISPVPSAPPVTASPLESSDEAMCENADLGYRLAYPADWFVHPADPELGIPPCALFAAEPFTYRPDVPTGFGASVYVIDFEGSCLEFDGGAQPDVLEAVTVAELPAYRIESGPDNFLPQAYLYLVNLLPDAGPVLGGAENGSCEGNHALYIRTEGAGPGDYLTNKLVVDRMAATLSVH